MSYTIDRIINNFLTTNNSFSTSSFPKFNVIQEDNIFKVSYALAGYSKDDINVEYEKKQIYSILTVSSKVEHTEESENSVVHYHGISKQDFEHKIRFPYNTKVSSCKYNNGMLEVIIEMDEEEINKNTISIE